MPITVFKSKHKLATVVAIKNGGTSHAPGSGNTQAIITELGPITIFTRKRNAACLTAKAGNERRIAPTRATKAKIAFHRVPANDTTRRVDKPQRCLKCSHGHAISQGMMNQLTDRKALIRNRERCRSGPALFLHEAAADEIDDRLKMVNRSFTDAVVITGFPGFWSERILGATCITDDETLDLEVGRHDLIVHAMCLHWANDPVGQLIQARRALKPDGLFLGIFFGGGTLNELRSSLAQAESDVVGGLSPRVAPMAEIRDLGALLQRAGFALPVADTVKLTATYASPLDLMRDLRAMGEASALSGRPRHPMRRDVLFRASSVYVETFGAGDRVPATFDLMVLTGWAPHENQPQPLRPGSASARLADALETKETPLKD